MKFFERSSGYLKTTISKRSGSRRWKDNLSTKMRSKMPVSSLPISVGCIEPVGILYASTTKYLSITAMTIAIVMASMLSRHGRLRVEASSAVESGAEGSGVCVIRSYEDSHCQMS